MPRRPATSPWQPFPPSAPLPVEGGLTVSSRRGAMAATWWSRRFVEVLESYGLGGRLQRGRRYARQGQIVSLDVSPGLLTATVQGSRPEPYAVTVRVAEPSEGQWRLIDAALRAEVGLAAHLLAGEVPPHLEAVFDTAGVPLFPVGWRDLTTRCSCPDVVNPCKHVAAVLYLFADRLDADPWLVLQWRGRGRDDVLAALGIAAVAGDDGLPPWWPLAPGDPLPDPTPGGEELAAPPEPPHAVLARMAELPVTAWQVPLTDSLPALYAVVLAASADADDRPG